MKLVIYGKPATKGSSRAFPRRSGGITVLPDNRPALKAWETIVRDAAQAEATIAEGTLATGPMLARATWWLGRPKGHLTSKGEIRNGAPHYPIAKPDLDKLARAIFDALKGVVYGDDAQLVELQLRKRYADHGAAPRLELEVLELHR